MRIRTNWTNRYRIALWFMAGGCGYTWFIDPTFFERYTQMRTVGHWLDPDYGEYKERQKYQWEKYLQRWSPQHQGNMTDPSMGLMSSTVLDKYLFGPQRLQQPPQYEHVCDEFIKLAEKSGVDPAKPLYDTIKKMVDYYYPEDLDQNLNETQQVIKPQIQWVFQTDLDAFVEEEEKKS